MIRIRQVKLPLTHTGEELTDKIRKKLRLGRHETFTYEILKRSIDARSKPVIYSYVIDVMVKDEKRFYQTLKDPQISMEEQQAYQFPHTCTRHLPAGRRPVIIGFGPAGLFCGYILALHGFQPIILERGCDVEQRARDVELFWKTGVLNAESNVQFGEGGAGTFSDGKLNTLVKDQEGRNRAVLSILVQAGAPEQILYDQKPHIGTDILQKVVKNMRSAIIEAGGQVNFRSKVTRLCVEQQHICGVTVNDSEYIEAEQVILAVGHSARDTFQMLCEQKIPMESKAFAVGFRIEHPQVLINRSQYGDAAPQQLGAAPYKLTANTTSGRGVYSFCMCPGGVVVNASSEAGRLAVNGMSYSDRGGSNANSAIVVSVTPKDFPNSHPLAGIEFQRQLEERAFRLGNGKVPVSRYGDYKQSVLEQQNDPPSFETQLASQRQMIPAEFLPAIKGEWAFAPLHEILPQPLNQDFVEGMTRFGGMIKGFDDDYALLSGVESRTSSPIRIPRDASWQSATAGLYPCGEGAGYAGGITSAAMDGLKIAEAVAENILQSFRK